MNEMNDAQFVDRELDQICDALRKIRRSDDPNLRHHGQKRCNMLLSDLEARLPLTQAQIVRINGYRRKLKGK